jgi:hypothetical protein
MLVSLGKMISVISDWVLATVRAAGFVSAEVILGLLHLLDVRLAGKILTVVQLQ